MRRGWMQLSESSKEERENVVINVVPFTSEYVVEGRDAKFSLPLLYATEKEFIVLTNSPYVSEEKRVLIIQGKVSKKYNTYIQKIVDGLSKKLKNIAIVWDTGSVIITRDAIKKDRSYLLTLIPKLTAKTLSKRYFNKITDSWQKKFRWDSHKRKWILMEKLPSSSSSRQQDVEFQKVKLLILQGKKVDWMALSYILTESQVEELKSLQDSLKAGKNVPKVKEVREVKEVSEEVFEKVKEVSEEKVIPLHYAYEFDDPFALNM